MIQGPDISANRSPEFVTAATAQVMLDTVDDLLRAHELVHFAMPRREEHVPVRRFTVPYEGEPHDFSIARVDPDNYRDHRIGIVGLRPATEISPAAAPFTRYVFYNTADGEVVLRREVQVDVKPAVAEANELWRMGMANGTEFDENKVAYMAEHAAQATDDVAEQEQAYGMDLVEEQTAQQILASLQHRLTSSEHRRLMRQQTRAGRFANALRGLLRRIW